jgi:hypothetical protein
MAPLPLTRTVAPYIARMAFWLLRTRPPEPRRRVRSAATMPSREVGVLLVMRGLDGKPFPCVEIGFPAAHVPPAASEAERDAPVRRRA